MDDNFLHAIEQIVTGLGYECVHTGIRNDAGKLRLQILIDTLGGINVDDCEKVSKRVNKFLDESPDIPETGKGRYYLEVSSPGVERPLYKLNDYERFSGKEARLRLSDPIEGKKTFTGIIIGINDGYVETQYENSNSSYVELKCEDGNYSIPFTNIKGANLVFRFESEKHTRKSSKKGRKE